MTFSNQDQAYVWSWLPGASEPVVAGLLSEQGGEVSFIYGASYLEREDAVPLYTPELPLGSTRIRPLPDLDAPGCILDAGPDAWGQRVVINRLTGTRRFDGNPAEFGTLTYLLESGSNRIGALDFQSSPVNYQPRGIKNATLEELVSSAERVEHGVPLTPELDAALIAGSSIGGARPKALIDDGQKKLIAKFSSTTDNHPVVKGEFVAMRLARLAGLDVAGVQLTEALDKTVLLIERFDRVPGSDERLAIVSALTMLELNELAARWASYCDLAQIVRKRFTQPKSTLRELFSRITFNILVGNTDDHARNHAAFWDGRELFRPLTLTPAYDICPQPRSTGEVRQAMIIGEDSDGFKDSRVAGCVDRSHLYQLTKPEAKEIVDRQIDVIETGWDEVCDEAELGEAERNAFHGKQFINPSALYGYQP